jgi:hypothetical protein
MKTIRNKFRKKNFTATKPRLDYCQAATRGGTVNGIAEV